jgi:hypothetical protein
MEGGRRQGDTLHGESWVSQNFHLAKERKDLGSAMTPEPGWTLGSPTRSPVRSGGGGGDQGRRTPHRPDASSTGRKPSLTSKPRLAGGTPASAAWGGTEREKEGGPLPCERERACAGVHEYANGVYGARVRTPTPRPLTAVRTVVAAR